MRRIERTNAFLRDFRREKRGHHRRDLEAVLTSRRLPASGGPRHYPKDWRDHRECHLKPDLLLSDRKPDTEVLQFVRLGLHSELFG